MNKYLVMKNMKVIDLCTDRTYDQMWFNIIEQIDTGNDPLKDNYLTINFDDFKSFTAVVFDNTIIAFSGLQHNSKRWGDKSGRLLSRFYISPTYRHGLSLFNSTLYTEFMLPIQLAAARNLKLTSVFISREQGINSFGKFITYINQTISDTNFTVLNGKYDVCGIENPVPDSCKQYVALKLLSDNGKDDWNKKMLFRRFS
jgi:hypothetical protein